MNHKDHLSDLYENFRMMMIIINFTLGSELWTGCNCHRLEFSSGLLWTLFLRLAYITKKSFLTMGTSLKYWSKVLLLCFFLVLSHYLLKSNSIQLQIIYNALFYFTFTISSTYFGSYWAISGETICVYIYIILHLAYFCNVLADNEP